MFCPFIPLRMQEAQQRFEVAAVELAGVQAEAEALAERQQQLRSQLQQVRPIAVGAESAGPLRTHCPVAV